MWPARRTYNRRAVMKGQRHRRDPAPCAAGSRSCCGDSRGGALERAGHWAPAPRALRPFLSPAGACSLSAAVPRWTLPPCPGLRVLCPQESPGARPARSPQEQPGRRRQLGLPVQVAGSERGVGRDAGWGGGPARPAQGPQSREPGQVRAGRPAGGLPDSGRF